MNTVFILKEHRSFDFRPELSAGHQFDPFIVPNVPFLTAAWELSKSDYWKVLGFNAITGLMSLKPFVVGVQPNLVEI